MVKLNLGCGKDRKKGWTNWDIDKMDLRSVLWPILPESVNRILLQHVMEHLDGTSIKNVMFNSERSLKPGGELEIRVPFYRCMDMLGDPTHITKFELETWNHVTGYSDLKLKKLELFVNPFPLLGFPDDYELSSKQWKDLSVRSEQWSKALTELIVTQQMRFVQELVPSYLRVEWVAIYSKEK